MPFPDWTEEHETFRETVRRFTEDIQRDKILTVGTVMRPHEGDAAGEPIKASELVASVAGRVLTAEGAVPVVDDTGASVGAINRDDVVAAIYGD